MYIAASKKLIISFSDTKYSYKCSKTIKIYFYIYKVIFGFIRSNTKLTIYAAKYGFVPVRANFFKLQIVYLLCHYYDISFVKNRKGKTVNVQTFVLSGLILELQFSMRRSLFR